MLIKTTQELKNYLPANAELEIDAVKPFMERSGENILLAKYTGDVLMGKLQKGYSNANLSDKMKELRDAVCYPLANFLLLKHATFSQVTFGKGGARMSAMGDSKAPFEHQMLAIRNECREGLFEGIEALLRFLEKNKAESDFADWLTSTGYTEFHELYIKTADEFNECYDIGSSRRTFHALRSSMREAEQLKLVKILGDEYNTELKTQQKAGSLNSNNKKVMVIVKQALAYLSVAAASARMPVKLTADGLQLISTSERQALEVKMSADNDKIKEMIADAQQKGDAYLKELQLFLYKNKSTYTTWASSSAYADPSAAAPDQSDNGVFVM